MLRYDADATLDLRELLTLHERGDREKIWENKEKIIQQIKDLIERGADWTNIELDYACFAEDNHGNSLLLTALLMHENEFARYLVDKTPNHSILNKPDRLLYAKNTPLIMAIKCGYYDLAMHLIEKGADVHATSGIRDFTPLHFACALLGIDQPENPGETALLIQLIEKLIAAGARVDAKNQFGSTPIDLLKHDFKAEEFLVYQFKVSILKNKSSTNVGKFRLTNFRKWLKENKLTIADAVILENPLSRMHRFYLGPKDLGSECNLGPNEYYGFQREDDFELLWELNDITDMTDAPSIQAAVSWHREFGPFDSDSDHDYQAAENFQRRLIEHRAAYFQQNPEVRMQLISKMNECVEEATVKNERKLSR